MKKVTLVFLAIVLCLSMAACSEKSSGISITALETKLKDSDSDFYFEVTESGDGYSFTGKGSDEDMECSGTTDDEKNLKTITITHYDVPVNTVCDANELERIAETDWNHWTLSDLDAIGVFADLLTIYNLIDTPESEETPEANLYGFFENNETIELNGWKISSEINDGTVKINAVFG